MPHISLTLYKGRDEETLKELAEKLQASLVDPWKSTDLSVSIKEVDPDDFTKEVDKLVENGDKLVIESDYYKK